MSCSLDIFLGSIVRSSARGGTSGVAMWKKNGKEHYKKEMNTDCSGGRVEGSLIRNAVKPATCEISERPHDHLSFLYNNWDFAGT